MRKSLRLLLLVLAVLVVPVTRAKEEITCYPASYFWHPSQGFRCAISNGHQCMVCYMVMEVT